MTFKNLYINQDKNLIVERVHDFTHKVEDKFIEIVTCYIVANRTNNHIGLDRFLKIEKSVFDRDFTPLI